MNILILNWRDPKHPLAGGAEISLLEHAKYWQKKGAKITWFSAQFLTSKNHEISEGITYIRRGSHYTVHARAFFYLLKMEKKQFDVVIDNFHFLPFFTPIYLKNTRIIAFIHEVAGNVWYKNLPWFLAFIGYHVEPLFFKPYKNIHFITVSDSTKQELIKEGIKRNNISIINNGVTRVITKVDKDEYPTVLFLGRVSQDKGIEDALKAFIKIAISNPRAQFWIAGKEERPGLFQALKKKYASLDGKIKYWGFVSEEEKFNLLKRAWLLIHPSAKEGWGLTVIEAATQATPTVAYDVEGLRDSIQNQKTGILVNGNCDDLSKAVLHLFKNPKELQILSKNAQEYSQQFDWEKSGRKSWGIISSI